MSKAMLIIDMPEYCDECPLYVDKKDFGDWCVGADMLALDRNKPSWCPLKEVVIDKLKSCDIKSESLVDVWNSCIDEILNKA